MQLDIYRDQALEKLLIVEEGKDIHTLSIDEPTFLKGLGLSRTIDPDFSGLPTGIDKDKVLEQIRLQGYFKTTLVVALREIDG
ncbi:MULTISPECIES: hypothetical protein [Pseudomonas]|uniref:hypothetical protein n=1 Tax=Pseudomonas TaxID=286 RepID=UPI00087A7C15|nr:MULTISPECIES: hypothetical protein [Pseudomonas]AZD93120.1 hypothetical protein C4K13_3704 [Pseudomonas chlororaphis subsp. aureofaciens]AZE36634.1 hypothetical protein C4K06_3602 [Pseudomonas chlororaphis subsp. aureofaciens]KAB0532720.1 hypothetical protein F7R16_10755 [Pseudomonas chlororaphis subsp. aureofaciens]TSD26092.1 hypothetical protein FCE86_032035 [Pseudomonas sp. ATCC 13985]WDG57921.1 hypothetical protein PUP52_18935 [Pseudomonas chlororaphis]